MRTHVRAESRVENVSHAGFKEFVTGCEQAIVLIGWSSPSDFSSGIETYFAAEYGETIRFGYFDRTQVPNGWFAKQLRRTIAAQLAAQPFHGGYCLFRRGDAVAYHSATVTDTSVATVSFGTLIVGLAFDSDVVTGGALSFLDKSLCDAVIPRFEFALSMPFATVAAETNLRGAEPLPGPVSSYEVLEVAPDASDDEVKAAWRKKQEENHPDRVGHMGAKLQAVATLETQAINRAYDDIKQQRGIR